MPRLGMTRHANHRSFRRSFRFQISFSVLKQVRLKGDWSRKLRQHFTFRTSCKFYGRSEYESILPVLPKTKPVIYFDRRGLLDDLEDYKSGVEKAQQRNRRPSTYVGRPMYKKLLSQGRQMAYVCARHLLSAL